LRAIASPIPRDAPVTNAVFAMPFTAFFFIVTFFSRFVYFRLLFSLICDTL